MRVLTQKEKEVFAAAHAAIERIASAEADSLFDIKVGGHALPGIYIDFAAICGGLRRMKNTFYPGNEAEAKKFLMRYCFEHRVQPRSFQLKGLISIEKRKAPVVHTYASETVGDDMSA